MRSFAQCEMRARPTYLFPPPSKPTANPFLTFPLTFLHVKLILFSLFQPFSSTFPRSFLTSSFASSPSHAASRLSQYCSQFAQPLSDSGSDTSSG